MKVKDLEMPCSEAVSFRLEKHKKSLEKGYLEMSRINCQLAEEGLSSDNDALSLAEHNLRSVNNCDS